MAAEHSDLFCKHCGSRWHMNEYGRMESMHGSADFSHIPDWYEWEREQVIGEIKEGTYRLKAKIHTEYNYRGKGQCVTLSTLDNTYFLFPIEDGFNATKIQFATEYLYEAAKSNLM